MELADVTLDLEQNVEIQGPIADVFKSVLHRFGEGNVGPDGKSLEMKLEAFAGGRWYRDRANGAQHLWGHVQVIKAPALLEISGPLFMSYPSMNHIEIKLTETNGLTKVSFRHRAMGWIDPAHRKGLGQGWGEMLASVKADFSKAGATA